MNSHKHSQEGAIKAFQERTGDISTNTYAALLMFAEETLEEKDRELLEFIGEDFDIFKAGSEDERMNLNCMNIERSRIRTYINNKEK